MSVIPIVRYMILCEDWENDPANPTRINIVGLLSNIDSIENPPYPLMREELCVFLVLTEARGHGLAEIVCAFEETGQWVFKTPPHSVFFGNDPLDVIGVPFRILDCPFPSAGLNSVQFWYNGEKVEERVLRLR